MPNGNTPDTTSTISCRHNKTSKVVLPGYQAQIGDDAVLHSQTKLQDAAKDFVLPMPFDIVSRPCATEDETVGYRCKCSFQIIKGVPLGDTATNDDSNNSNNNNIKKQQFHYRYIYAMRHKRTPIALDSTVFPIANRRIQIAMQQFAQHVLNNNIISSDGEGDTTFTTRCYPHLVNTHLTSLTFAASWNEYHPIGQKPISDCILTLHYDHPLQHERDWRAEAQQICQQLQLTQLHGRSKKIQWSAFTTESSSSSVSTSPAGSLGMKSVLRDTIFLFPPCHHQDDNRNSWTVSLSADIVTKETVIIPVHYHKPEDAFFHPNAAVMCQALQWMLDRIAFISFSATSPCRLLELYCGCGAHTIALAKSGLLHSIQAVELDQRLVDACQVNIALNKLEAAASDTESRGGSSSTSTMSPVVQVIRGDAGKWARLHQQQKKKQQNNFQKQGETTRDQDQPCNNILLVDPPRQGLDPQVIDMAVQADYFQHVLIISCGHEALVRDLKQLCIHFEIVNCTQLDLFPRTDSVETLVHLTRRRRVVQ